MADGSVIAYNVAVFISTLFVLEFGSDKFVDHTAIVARRTGIPDTIIALLTAGAEWEEVGFKCSGLGNMSLLTRIGFSLLSLFPLLPKVARHWQWVTSSGLPSRTYSAPFH